MHRVFLFTGILCGLILPEVAAASIDPGISGIVGAVVQGTPLATSVPGAGLNCPAASGAGACALASMLAGTVGQVRNIVAWLAFLIIVIAGFRLIISQSDDALTTARRTILAAVVGLFLIFITEPLVDALYGGYSVTPPSGLVTTPTFSPAILSNEILGIVRWGETLVAMVAVTLIIVQAVAVLGSFGQEEVIRKAYRAVFYTVIGLLLVVFDRIIPVMFGAGVVGGPSANIFVTEIFGLVRLILGFVGVAVVAVVIYAETLMILNFGNDDFITKGKGILINAGIGLLLIMTSYVIVSEVILGI